MSFTDNSRRCLRWIRRFRHRRGYNIHSPFAFNLVTGVIYERGAYYAYDDLRNLRKTVPSKLRERDDRLLLRLINASMAKEALVVGDGLQMQTAYLRAGRPSCLFREITTSDLRTSKGNALKIHPVKVDFLYLDAPLELWPSAWKAVLSKRGEKAFFVVRGIHRSKKDFAAWQHLTEDTAVRVSFDLHDFGIACFEARFNKENHLINYF